MSLFQKDFFNILIKNYGFYIYEIEKENKWIAIKTVENRGLYSVIISKEDEEEENFREAKEFLESKGVPYSIHNVILSTNNLGSKKENSIITHDNYYRIVIDVKTKSINSYSFNSEPLVQILVSLFNGGYENKVPWYRKIKIGKTTAILMAINILVFIGSVLVSTFFTGRFFSNLLEVNPRVLYILGAKDTVSILYGGEYYRLITSMFLHGGLLHLAFNMYALYALGDTIEMIYGRVKYIIIYFFSGIMASIFSTIFASRYIGVGASGAIFGLLGAALVYAFYEKHRIGKHFFTNIIVVILTNAFIGLSIPNIDNSAHLGGLISGLALSLVFYNMNLKKRIK
ncbi:rhomboid family intramembrane serine protease [Clostridium tarantellae]|uniref:Rhomboid family intramembrane serine protease n=1 Tax=Clostridium tarantellae TaxID=39493 RepID=A0A6I1MT45_9CLOT|nr:rhomboid family intramembrane serine protease [Clostridium tarantellae]MPQ44041.1 rhomboid family intramembrane serine protease [Clostridium tarantellae]